MGVGPHEHEVMIDSHCHLAGAEFEPDLADIVQRARSAGVRSALVILSAGDAAEAGRAGRVRELWPEVRFSVGIHPHHAGTTTDDLDARIADLERELTTQPAVALGEIGLDYHYDFAPRAVQQEVFRRQLRVARERRLPVVLHTREAADDTFGILAEEGEGLRVVFHCFTGTMGMARRALAEGAWLSFAGIVTFPKATELRDVAAVVPADRLLAETDAPYLAPVPHRGRRNEPALVAHVVSTLAGLRSASVPDLSARITSNYETLFGGPLP